jgi:Family of unknown function (DUF6492)
VDIVLPLVAADLDRYVELQRPTFERFYADLATTWMVVPRADVGAVKDATRAFDGVRIVDELDLVPEIRLSQLLGRRTTRNWQLQQLVKLAAVAAVETDFALVVDADVIATHPVSDTDLVVDGRALRPREPEEDHPEWIATAAAALDMEPLDYTASVSPSVLARDAVGLLADYAAASIRPRRRKVRVAAWVPGLRRYTRSWRGHLFGVMPWTEYQLYDTFLVRTGAFERFHTISEDPVLYANCVWTPEEFATWVPLPERVGPRSFFSVVQGTSAPATAVAERLRAAGLLDVRGSGTA